MKSVNIHEAKTHLSRLVEEVPKGESVIIAKAGKAMAVLSPIETAAPRKRSFIGSMKGRITMRDDFDFDRHMEDEIAEMFGTKP